MTDGMAGAATYAKSEAPQELSLVQVQAASGTATPANANVTCATDLDVAAAGALAEWSAVWGTHGAGPEASQTAAVAQARAAAISTSGPAARPQERDALQPICPRI